MNDFTKEELEIIANGVAREIGRYSILKMDLSVPLNLSGKIQSMIDNYCDHQPIWEAPNHVICYCQVCKKVLEK